MKLVSHALLHQQQQIVLHARLDSSSTPLTLQEAALLASKIVSSAPKISQLLILFVRSAKWDLFIIQSSRNASNASLDV
jgi:hypothetical protein